MMSGEGVGMSRGGGLNRGGRGQSMGVIVFFVILMGMCLHLKFYLVEALTIDAVDIGLSDERVVVYRLDDAEYRD